MVLFLRCLLQSLCPLCLWAVQARHSKEDDEGIGEAMATDDDLATSKGHAHSLKDSREEESEAESEDQAHHEELHVWRIPRWWVLPRAFFA